MIDWDFRVLWGFAVAWLITILLTVAGCTSSTPRSQMIGCDSEACGVRDAQADCDACWRVCGRAESFNDALICSMECTELCSREAGGA